MKKVDKKECCQKCDVCVYPGGSGGGIPMCYDFNCKCHTKTSEELDEMYLRVQPLVKEINKCILSAQYGSDNFHNLSFYCNFCSKEMGYKEDRECLAEREKCSHCKSEIGDDERSVSTCFKCNKEI